MSKQLRRCAGIVEAKRVFDERDILFWNPRACKSLYHVALDPPRHRTNKTFRRWWRVRGADFQDLCDQCRIIGNPVPHNDPPSGPGHAYHLLGHIKRFWREHGSKDAHDKIKRMIFQLVQIGRIAFLKLAVREALLLCTFVPSLNQVARDIDAQYVRSESRLW